MPRSPIRHRCCGTLYLLKAPCLLMAICLSKTLISAALIFAFVGMFSDRGLAANPDPAQPDRADKDSRAVSTDKLRELYAPDVFRADDSTELPYRLMRPVGFDEQDPDSGKTFPLVLFLHGAGERGDDNFKQLAHGAAEFARADRRKSQQAFVVFPQCPKEKQWVETSWGNPTGAGSFPDQPSAPLAAALRLVETLSRQFPIDPTRVYLTGLSMGGYGTWYAAGHRPDQFAAALVVCGGGDPEWASRYSGMPIWSVHGGNDRVVPAQRGREIVAALVTAGHDGELHYSEYPGVGHNSWTRTYARDDIHQWLFRQRREAAKPQP